MRLGSVRFSAKIPILPIPGGFKFQDPAEARHQLGQAFPMMAFNTANPTYTPVNHPRHKGVIAGTDAKVFRLESDTPAAPGSPTPTLFCIGYAYRNNFLVGQHMMIARLHGLNAALEADIPETVSEPRTA